MPTPTSVAVRPYAAADERGWLLCRLLAFFDTGYYDDVHTARTIFDRPAIRLVAVHDSQVVGLLDIEIFGELATVDCIAVHPDHQRAGIGARLLDAGTARLPAAVTTLDAWTREDQPAIAWYLDQGFAERDRYLHVYKSWDESADGFTAPVPLHPPLLAFCHASIDHEAELRARFARVYGCRRFVRDQLPPSEHT